MSLERGAARSGAALGAPSTLSYLWLVSNAFLDFPRVLPNAKFFQIDAKRAEVRAPSLHLTAAPVEGAALHAAEGADIAQGVSRI